MMPKWLFGLVLMTLALFTGAGRATAGDGAALNVLGFSPDGRYFAFEQYGIEDGVGDIYSSITVIEVAGDRPVKGTPVTVVIGNDDPDYGKDPEKRLPAVRTKAAANAAPLLQPLSISQPGRLVASTSGSRAREILDFDMVKTAQKAVVGSLPMPKNGFGPDARLVLREFDIAMPRCKDVIQSGHPNGFGLTLERKGRPTIHLSRDQTIPEARGCPDRYGIAEVHALALPDGSTALAVVIQYFYTVSEGPDRRFLAVTGRVR